MATLFTYGTLMFAPIWCQVVGEVYETAPATLHGYVRRAVVGQHYPVVLPANRHNCVEGIVYFGVSNDNLAVLDEFEGIYYRRTSERVELSDSSMIAAFVYVLKDRYRSIAADHEWDPKQFIEFGMKPFLEQYSGFSSI
jgi:gamma-glutamylcyclotransferase (GGCT)/AIG2-like uncharacterized protein YtfP